MPELKDSESKIPDSSSLARELVDKIAAIATPPPATPIPDAPDRRYAAGSTLEGARMLLENRARFVSPVLPTETRMRAAKSLFLRAFRMVTRDQTVFNTALLESLRTAYRELDAALQEIHTETRALEQRERELAARLSEALAKDQLRLEALAKDHHGSQLRLDALERERQTEGTAELRTFQKRLDDELRGLKMEWTVLRRDLRGGLPGAPAESGAAATVPPANDALRAGLYADFEHRFRGSEDEIRRRQTADVALFRGALGRVADLGCGRGEFLELLAAAGLSAFGCDANPMMVERAKEKGLAVDRADLFAWLSGQADASLGGVTAYQVVEHLPPAKVFDLVELASAKLAPGGRILLETINPESVYAMRWFWMDLSHERPLPAPSLAQLLSASGFRDVTVNFRSPVPPSEGFAAEEAGDPRLAMIARLLFAAQDYAVTGVK